MTYLLVFLGGALVGLVGAYAGICYVFAKDHL
jgi:hypothetical protein